MIASFLTSIRLVIATMAICVAGYSFLIWGVGQALTPETARGHIIRSADGTIVGSSQIAQKFTRPEYFWPRPSAVDYNGAGAGGSNKSPTSADVTARATETVAAYGATAENPLPAELAAASGGGLDPHITERAALYQAARIASARGIPLTDVETLINEHSFSPGGVFTPSRLANVLELNLALDARQQQTARNQRSLEVGDQGD
jgi:K+-transporting ATPase ATPase C chain